MPEGAGAELRTRGIIAGAVLMRGSWSYMDVAARLSIQFLQHRIEIP